MASTSATRSRAVFRVILSAAALGMAACSQGTGPQGDDDAVAASVSGLRLEPESPTVTVGPGNSQEVAFTAVILKDDGSEEPTTYVTWSSTNASLGTLSERGVFSTFDDRGGTTNITAEYFGYQATTRLTVVYEEAVDAVELPDGARDLFAAEPAAAPEDGPAMIYPNDQVILPKNVPEITFMWNPGTGGALANLFRLTFSSPIMRVSVYTEGTSWITEPALWRIVSGSNAGGQITVQLTGLRYHVEDGVAVADTAPVDAAPIGIHVDRLDAHGSIYYFSATDNGIKRIDLEQRGAEDFLLALDVGAACVSCHVLDQGGSRMALSYSEGGVFKGAVYDIQAGAGSEQLLFGGFVADLLTWSPDGQWLLTNLDGALTLYSASDWSSYEVPTTSTVAQPEWSPDGDRILLVKVPEDTHFGGDLFLQQGAIAYLDVLGPGEIDPEPHVLVESDGTNNNYFPTFSPNGEWIAFTRAAEGESYWAASAEIWVVHRDGGEPIRLDAALDGTNQHDSWPRWAPISDSDYLWLTYSSVRNYGFFNLAESTPQIWVTAFDEAKAAAGVDPSAPAFWLADQDLDSHNHIPVWGP